MFCITVLGLTSLTQCLDLLCCQLSIGFYDALPAVCLCSPVQFFRASDTFRIDFLLIQRMLFCIFSMPKLCKKFQLPVICSWLISPRPLHFSDEPPAAPEGSKKVQRARRTENMKKAAPTLLLPASRPWTKATIRHYKNTINSFPMEYENNYFAFSLSSSSKNCRLTLKYAFLSDVGINALSICSYARPMQTF